MPKDKRGFEPAFPCRQVESMGRVIEYAQPGMSKRAYAAIELGVPDSGEEWLDEMIRKSNHFKAVCCAMKGILSYSGSISFDREEIIGESCRFADELLKQENDT